MRFWQTYSIQLITIAIVNCDRKEEIKSKNPLPYFRRQVEGLSEDPNIKDPHSYTPKNNFITFLVKNVKDIFGVSNDNYDATELYLLSTTTITITPAVLNQTIRDNIKAIEDPKLTDDVMGYMNLSLNTVIDMKLYEPVSSAYEYEITDKDRLIQIAKKIKSMEKTEVKLQIGDQNWLSTSTWYDRDTSEALIDSIEPLEARRSCIYCNNVETEDCNNPKNKLIPSTLCQHEGDVCYSQHTPFGVVDRGCFNVTHNLATYVCSCNLCNYISISEMPYFFSTKREWVDNVIELSRTRHFRKSVFKNMACLQCEVDRKKNPADSPCNTNCLEGNIGHVPTQICAEDEVCAVKAIKHEGYIWRGCVKTPLYNYYWSLCDTDLCNHDTLISIHDLL